MKNPCPLCGKRKAQRRCISRNSAEICSLCCAELRNETCGDCSHYIVSQKYNAARRLPAALPDGHFIVELNPEVEAAIDSAMELADQGKTDAAWTAVTRLLRDHPRDHLVCYGMGVLHALKGEAKEAVKWFDKAISIFPYFVEAHYNKGAAYQEQFDIGNAIRSYRKVVEFGDPNDIPAKQAQSFLDTMAAAILQNNGVDLDSFVESQSEFKRAFTLMEQEDWSGALAGFRASAAKNERNASTHGNMGLCLAKLGRKAQSLAELERALEIDSRYEPARTNHLVIEDMVEGVPLKGAGFKHVEFGKEQFLAKSGAKLK